MMKRPISSAAPLRPDRPGDIDRGEPRAGRCGGWKLRKETYGTAPFLFSEAQKTATRLRGYTAREVPKGALG